MSTTHAFVEHYSSSSFTYSLNSPDLDSILSNSPSGKSKLTRRARAQSTYAPLSPSFHASTSHLPVDHTSPEPVLTSRRSVQFAKGLNWARSIPQESVPPVPALTIPQQSANARSRQMRNRSPDSASPPSSSDDELPMTPSIKLPPGAAAATAQPARNWAVVTDCKGLGVSGIAEFERDMTPNSTDSSDAGSLAGDSMHTASSGSTPMTPTRLQFISDSFDSLSNPVTLDELRSLKASAAELDMESKRLRRLRGRADPPVSPKVLPRKAVPQATAVDLARPPARRRPAVRHSLIVSSPRVEDGSIGTIHSFAPEPLGEDPFAERNDMFAAPGQSAAAARRPFYAQGKAAMSVIEFSPRKEQEEIPCFARRHVSGNVPTLAQLKAEMAAKRAAAAAAAATAEAQKNAPAAAPQVVSPPPTPPKAAAPRPTVAIPPLPPVPATVAQPERTLSFKASSGFLGKHKKLSRFLGKAAA